MITFLTTAKSFMGEARQRQLNALKSWKAVCPDVQILLFGTGDGYAGIVAELDLEWFPDVACGPSGCPRIDTMFAIAEQHARHAVKAYVNCDIMLGPDLADALRRVGRECFLLTCQRLDVDWSGAVDFNDPSCDWFSIVSKAHEDGVLMAPSGIDMFLYRGDFWGELPELVVGRGGYDNYLMFYCRLRNIPVIDGTEMVTIIHQNHDYGHLAGGRKEVFQGREASENICRAGGLRCLFTIRDADFRLTEQGVVRNRYAGSWREYCEHVRVLNLHAGKRPTSSTELLSDIVGEWQLRKTWPSGGKSVSAGARFAVWAFLRLCGRR